MFCDVYMLVLKIPCRFFSLWRCVESVYAKPIKSLCASAVQFWFSLLSLCLRGKKCIGFAF